ncbi:hypothetical protein C8Q74DRAFT_1188125 [Fomes fomentarius]|nr:hypothetical protein C8Q74DRAFT_1188125 [Fomes fomentarius]
MNTESISPSPLSRVERRSPPTPVERTSPPPTPVERTSPPPTPVERTSPPLTPAERALKESLLPREFRDVHLYAFSRRTIYPDGSIKIDHPQPIFAIGSILKDSDYFSNLLTSGFSEANTESRANPIRQCALESEYDYETDSDLDEFEEVYSPVAVASTSSSATFTAKGKSKDEGPGAGEPPNGTSGVESSVKQRQILLPSIAHRTLKACIFYVYTGKVNFLPLRSEGASNRQFALFTTSEVAPACSPKSMYRLAELYGMSELQTLAYQEIVLRLTPANIVEEAFSSFFARYDRLREHAVSYLSQHYSDPGVQDTLPDTIERVVLGDMPHAGNVLRSLLGLRVVIAPSGFTGHSARPAIVQACEHVSAAIHPPELRRPLTPVPLASLFSQYVPSTHPLTYVPVGGLAAGDVHTNSEDQPFRTDYAVGRKKKMKKGSKRSTGLVE